MPTTPRDLQLREQRRATRFEPDIKIYRGFLIAPFGTVQVNEGDNSLLWVQGVETGNSNAFKAYNPGVIQDIREGMAVLYREDPKAPARWALTRFDKQLYYGDPSVYDTLPDSTVEPHAANHEFPPGRPGSDYINIHARAIVDFAVRPTSPASMKVRVYSGWYPGATNYEFFEGPVNTKDFTSDIPASAGDARLVAITIDTSGTLGYVNGNTYTDGLKVPAAAKPTVTTDKAILTAIKLANGMAEITEAEFIHEIRPLLSPGGLSGAVDRGKVSKVYQPDGSDVVLEADGNANLNVTAYGDLQVIGNVTAWSFAFIVENTSGAVVAAGDVGYIDEAGEFKTTTTASDVRSWAAVLIGGADSSDIYVTSRGRVTVNYTGSAPAAGDYLVTSTTAGDAQAQSYTSPAIFAVCTAAGSGGTVEAQLLCNRIQVPMNISVTTLSVNNANDSDFVSTIAAAGVVGDKIYYSTVTSGDVNAISPASLTDAAKIIIHNTTQTEEAFIISTGTDGTGNFIQVSNSADISGWVSTDAITCRSQTNTTTLATSYWFDVEFTSTEVPALAVAMVLGLEKVVDTGSAPRDYGFHTFEANSESKRQRFLTITTTNSRSPGFTTNIALIRRRFMIVWLASGSNTFQISLRVRAVEVAAP